MTASPFHRSDARPRLLDLFPAVSLANACLEAEQGLLDADELANLEFSYEQPECICPPDLLARGGFRGGCPVHV